MNLKKILILICVVILLALSMFQPLRAYEEFYFDNYSIELDVKENGEIHVKETFNTKFTGYLHGIYIDIPSSYEMTWEDGTRKDYYFPVTDVKVISNHEYLIENYLEGVQIRLGSEYSYALENEIYKIEYIIHTKDLELDGRQMLFYNIISKNWDTYFNKVDFTIKLPKSIDVNTIVFDTPEGIVNNSNQVLTYSYQDNNIQGTYNLTLPENEAITIWVELPNDYFNFPSYVVYNIIAIGLGTIFTTIMYLVFLKKGKDELLVPVIEFSAPDGLTSAEVGYIIDGVCDTNDVISLILYWAQKGYLTIEELEKEDLLFHKVMDLPENAKSYEKTLFKKLFNNRNDVKSSELKGSFYEVLNTTVSTVHDYFSIKSRKIYQSKGLQFLTCLLAGFPLAILVAMQMFAQMKSIEFALIAFGIYLGIVAAITALLIYIFNRWYVSTKVNKIAILTIAGILIVGLFIVSYFIYHTVIHIAFLVLATVLCVATMFMSANMRQRSKYGNELLGRIIGLREFIMTAEKDRLDMLVKDNPTIFYDILPFAFAFGITDIWNEHFKDMIIAPCTWYTCNGPYPTSYHMSSRINRSMNQFRSDAMYIPPTEKSSGDFSGGSGGGFSGGGFGGSGGGGW